MNFIQNRIEKIKALAKSEEGLTTVEYAIILMLVAIVAFTAWTRLGSAVSKAADKGAGTIEGLSADPG